MITTWPTRWPASAREVADGMVRLSAALRASDTEAIADAVHDLSSGPDVRAPDLYAAVMRMLLEAAHPDGLDSDDVGAVVKDAVVGDPDVPPSDVVAVVLGTLGVHPEPERPVVDEDSQDPDDHRNVSTPVIARMDPQRAVRASAGVVQVLLVKVGSPIESVITMVVDDVAAAETIEWP